MQHTYTCARVSASSRARTHACTHMYLHVHALKQCSEVCVCLCVCVCPCVAGNDRSSFIAKSNGPPCRRQGVALFARRRGSTCVWECCVLGEMPLRLYTQGPTPARRHPRALSPSLTTRTQYTPGRGIPIHRKPRTRKHANTHMQTGNRTHARALNTCTLARTHTINTRAKHS
jgi:hypothetical protein